MLYAVLSDTHSNLEALQAVLEALEKHNCDSILFLGDLLGYGASPNECVELARMHNFTTILGNHDRAILNGRKIDTFNEYARLAVQWTDAMLTEENRTYLNSCPISRLEAGFLLVHGALTGTDDYIMNSQDIANNLELLRSQYPDCDLVFYGHTHIKAFFSDKNRVNTACTDKEFTLEKGDTFFINPGSVGQPRDGSPDASFGLYDSERRTYRQYSIPYDVESAQKKILDNGLPAFLADRLAKGR